MIKIIIITIIYILLVLFIFYNLTTNNYVKYIPITENFNNQENIVSSINDFQKNEELSNLLKSYKDTYITHIYDKNDVFNNVDKKIKYITINDFINLFTNDLIIYLNENNDNNYNVSLSNLNNINITITMLSFNININYGGLLKSIPILFVFSDTFNIYNKKLTLIDLKKNLILNNISNSKIKSPNYKYFNKNIIDDALVDKKNKSNLSEYRPDLFIQP